MSSSESPTVHKARSDIMVGPRTADPEREAKGRRDLAEAKIAEAIQRNLDKAPPLTPNQVKRLSALLRGGIR
ncbi:hypothetical protein QWJ90_06345 [Microbacterium oryzae]|uniref:hypothetical protein n=1 Tax=Microbacterium oryzae TaxID=743009 RepID=UPI0025B20541|nr:hypothetical protein [Microbacterium oryzae]MDN3310544.1 hypothetical protein [Microbacterium oryzae]